MSKVFISSTLVRDNALKLAKQIYDDGFIPDIIYVSLRGGAHMGNVISEFFKLVHRGESPVFYAAVVARSYTNLHKRVSVQIDGWTYHPKYLRPGDKVLFVDDIFDTGTTINHLVEYIISKGLPREAIRVAVHDYKKTRKNEGLPIKPDYWCRKTTLEEGQSGDWVHYLGHELEGLSEEEIRKYYLSSNPELQSVFDVINND